MLQIFFFNFIKSFDDDFHLGKEIRNGKVNVRFVTLYGITVTLNREKKKKEDLYAKKEENLDAIEKNVSDV